MGDARDDRGEDEIITVDGAKTTVQVVTIPTESRVWSDLRHNGEASLEGTVAEAVALIREALLRKAKRSRGFLLAINASSIGAIVSRPVLEAYFAAYPDPRDEFGFSAVWLVGPTVHSTVALVRADSV
jgi:hypothetical protein